MNRQEKIKFLIQAIWDVEEVQLNSADFEHYPEDQLDREVEFYDDVLDK